MRDDALEGGGQFGVIDSKVRKTRDRAAGIIGVEGREDQVTGQRCLNCDCSSLAVADFSNQDDVGILPKYRAKRGSEAEPRLLVDLYLHDSRNAVFDRILDGDDVQAAQLYLPESRIERRRFARARRSSDEQEPFAGFEEPTHSWRVRLMKA